MFAIFDTVQLKNCQLQRGINADDAANLALALAASSPWTTLGISAQALERYLQRQDDSLQRYAVRVNEYCVGVICIRYPWLRGPYIELLGLLETHRGLGIGKQLLDWAENQARRDHKNLWVVTSSFNETALQFYQRQGFRIVGTLDGLVKPEYDEILLRKSWD